MSKSCSTCGSKKRLLKDERYKDGVRSVCMNCHVSYTKAWRRKPRNKSKIRLYNARRVLKYKTLVINAYGGKCSCCGEWRFEFLSIDHTGNNGASHRREIGNGTNMYVWLKKAGFPKKGFRLLCFNCNLSRGHYGRCPHEDE